MMKPGMGAYDKFKELFERFSRQAGKEQYLIPYFIAAHPGTSDEDMMNLALWLKKNNFRLDQVQTFTPTPMAMATTMWHTRRNPLKRLSRSSEKVDVVRDGYRRKLHKAFLRYHHPDNWQIIHDALIQMGRSDLIGHSKHCLIPPTPPGDKAAAVRHKMGAPMNRGKSPGARHPQQGQRAKPAAAVGARGQGGQGGRPGAGKPQAGRSPAKPGGKTGRSR
ncbi:uncharacterized radical SAM protein YgiQ [Chromobacterium violaceum]|uniref:Uncharacterized radical SAM protein YgiQ n=2 Tax=Chromobacterium violaceum TaxID=536 RepID=A0A3S4I649_CHRVL|nr:uncharacterized radical SAM protein YgiQ [Chromobacterium violaceum]